MSCSDDNPYFDIGTHEGAFGAQGNSTEVLGMQIQRLYWSTSKIRGFNKHLLMNFKPRDFRAREAPPFMAGSSHDCFFNENDKESQTLRYYELSKNILPLLQIVT